MKPSQEYADIQTLSYEQAFDELESLVAGLEANQKSLDESMAMYERGQALAARCAALLDQAELRVRQLGDPGSPPADEDEFN